MYEQPLSVMTTQQRPICSTERMYEQPLSVDLVLGLGMETITHTHGMAETNLHHILHR
jgi:hypothetical protein